MDDKTKQGLIDSANFGINKFLTDEKQFVEFFKIRKATLEDKYRKMHETAAPFTISKNCFESSIVDEYILEYTVRYHGSLVENAMSRHRMKLDGFERIKKTKDNDGNLLFKDDAFAESFGESIEKLNDAIEVLQDLKIHPK